MRQSLKLTYRLILAASLVLAGILLIFNWLHKTVELTIDGESRRLTTFALTVADLLGSEKLALSESDLVSPSLKHWLKEGDEVAIQRAIQVPILADGRYTTILTAALVPAHIFTQAGIPFAVGDLVLADGEIVSLDEPLPKNPRTGRFPALQLQRSVPFTLTSDFQPGSLASPASTLGQALWQAGIVLSTDDSISSGLNTPLVAGSEFALQRARAITIFHKDGSLTAHVVADTVGEALALAGFPLQSLDYTIPAENDPIPEDGILRVVHVQEEIIIEQTPLPFEEEFQAAPDLEIDQRKVIQAGEYGIFARRIRVRYEDGQEISRRVEEEWTARQPQNRIIGYGTNLVEHTTDTPDGTISYWRAITMYAVSYSPSSAGGSITASGAPLKKGLVAVDTRYIPLGTRLYIPGYGEAIAADTGGGIRGRIIDLGYSDEDYVAWHQNVTVYFLWPPPANVVWIFP